MEKKYLQEDELKIGMRCTPEQLRHIYDKYMIVKFADRESKFLYPSAFEKGYLSCKKIVSL